MIFLVLFLSLSFLLADSALIVNTTYGALIGAAFTNTYPTSLFLGVPYASPPVGPLRFASPVPPARWDGIRSATALGPGCPQGTDVLDASTSEDCLYLNVFVPPSASPQNPLPVMFYIHGGSYLSGSGGWIVYHGSNIAYRNDVVAVTINYRLGALGGLYTGADTILGNFQLRDQRAALVWVQQNIASFGGDTSRVTIYGESAGGYSVITHLVSPASFGLFTGVIAESAPFGIPSQTPKSALELAALFLAKVGCPSVSNASHVSCVRGKSVGEITGAEYIDVSHPGYPAQMVWTPVVVPGSLDGLPYEPLEAIAQKKVAPGVSVIIGTNRDEYDAFIYEDFRAPLNYSSLSDQLTAYFGTAAAETLLTLYGSPPRNASDLRETYSAIQTDYVMGCPSRYAVRSLNTSYLYLYTHVNTFNPWLVEIGEMGPHCVDKACHTAELFLLFDPFYLLLNVFHPTPDEDRLSLQMQIYWTNLAKSGNPNLPVIPNIAWNLGAETLSLTLDIPISMAPNFHTAKCDFFDTIGYNRPQ